MADPHLVAYIREHAPAWGTDALKRHLLSQGVDAAQLDAALAEAAPTLTPLVSVPPAPPPGASPPTAPGRRRASKAGLIVGALCGGLGLMALSLFMGRTPAPDTKASAPAPEEAGLFHGRYGFIVKLPPGYEARSSFTDAEKTLEVVYIYRQGTDPQHFINEGLYEHLGILRIEVLPRRVPQGFVGMDALKDYVLRQLAADKSVFEQRATMVNGMPAFIVKVAKPFQIRRGYVVGDKVRYTVAGGFENPVFDQVLETLAETGSNRTDER
ncbi:hypothetical protein EPO15_03365 [bacterium]|nr:MAG: hypothetical protein EPO15_03365 [bacterium]